MNALNTEPVRHATGVRIWDTPSPSIWPDICRRAGEDAAGGGSEADAQAGSDPVRARVEDILAQVRRDGDAAVLRLTRQFDRAELERLDLTLEAVDEGGLEADAADEIGPELARAIRLAHDNLHAFHAAQKPAPVRLETLEGVTCWQRYHPLERVGLYIPGGSAPLFSSLLMLGVPARIAGCEELVVCTPPNPDGTIHPAIAFTARLLGIPRVFRMGGAQAIAAMAFGTETVPQVDKIFGPGNAYVTMAKQLVQSMGTPIDLPAGPSELLVLADSGCRPEFVAADLLSQAEHGPDSQVILLTDSMPALQNVLQAVAEQLPRLPRAEIAANALANSHAVRLENLDEALALSEVYGPEHLILATRDAERHAERIRNAGSVFLGDYSCESAGDYASGTNHTLPTGGLARRYSGVSLASFLRSVTYQQLSPAGLRAIGPAVQAMAHAEGLQAHRNAVTIRLEQLDRTESAPRHDD